MPKLWELSDAINDLESRIQLIQDDESLSDEEKEAKLESAFQDWIQTGQQFEYKSEQVARYIQHQEALANARRTEARRINALASQAENQAEKLRRYLSQQLQLSNYQKLEGTTAKISLRKKQPQLSLRDVEELPDELVKIERKPDKKAIKAYLQQHGKQPWGELVDDPQGYSVVIK